MKSFSERKGLKNVAEIFQTDSMNDELRNGLWNCLDRLLWSSSNFMYSSGKLPGMHWYARHLWANFYKQPTDTIPAHPQDTLRVIRKRFFEYSWHEVYDFIEFSAAYISNIGLDPAGKKRPYELFNSILKREISGYQFVNEQLSDITSQQEVEMLEEALSDTRFAPVSSHLQAALQLYSNRESPDYRNSIKESISAVESMAKIVTDNPKAMLSDALKALEKQGQLHKALKDGFEKLYAYTSDADGIRHAMLEEHNLTAADARYFLLSCTSFVNYLKSKI